MTSESSIGANYFDVDDDELIQNDSSNSKPLAWRGDPKETHSDWTIVVKKSGKEDALEKYHVHRVILAAGPRACEYFSTLFSTSAAVPEKEDHTCHITLEEQDAKFFAVMLDFLYSGTLDATTENAVALRSLARYFQCRELMRETNTFIQQDLSAETAAAYLVNAASQGDEKLQESAKKLVVDHFDKIEPHSFYSLSVDLFRSILSSLDLSTCSHEAVAASVCTFFEKNSDSLNVHDFVEMTSNLSGFSRSEAVRFTHIITKLDAKGQDEETCLELFKLCRKCTDDITRSHWQSISSHGLVRTFVDKCLRMPEMHEDGSCFVGNAVIGMSYFGSVLDHSKGDASHLQEEILALRGRIAELESELAETKSNKRKMTG